MAMYGSIAYNSYYNSLSVSLGYFLHTVDTPSYICSAIHNTMNKNELLVDYCQKCGQEIGSSKCCRSNTNNNPRIIGHIDLVQAKDPITHNRPKLEVTYRAISNADLYVWNEFCEKYEINPWCINEGLIKESDMVALDLEDALKWGLINDSNYDTIRETFNQ